MLTTQKIVIHYNRDINLVHFKKKKKKRLIKHTKIQAKFQFKTINNKTKKHKKRKKNNKQNKQIKIKTSIFGVFMRSKI